MSYGFKILAAVATMLCSSTVSAVPITIGFTAEVGRRINGPFDGPIQLGTLIEGWWTYDSNALPVTLDHDCCQNGITYVSEGPAYGVTIKADGLPAFTLPGTRINITNDLVISDGMMGNACGRGEFERTVDRYHVGIPNRSFEPFNWTMYNCSARAFESEVLPTYAPPLGDGLVEFVQGRFEGNVLIDLGPVGGPASEVFIKKIYRVSEPSTLVLGALAGLTFALCRTRRRGNQFR